MGRNLCFFSKSLKFNFSTWNTLVDTLYYKFCKHGGKKVLLIFVECAHYTEIESELDAIYLQIGGANITPQTLEYITII